MSCRFNNFSFIKFQNTFIIVFIQVIKQFLLSKYNFQMDCKSKILPISSENLNLAQTYQQQFFNVINNYIFLMNCTLGFFLSSSGSCANCPSNCWNCASADTCLACQTNYSISNGQCTESVDTTAKILIITLSAMFGCLIIMVILMIIGRKCNQSSRDREDGTDDNKINSQKQLNDENEPYNGKWISSQVNLGIIDNSRVCVICLEGGMNTLTECKHQFHNHCLGDWFKRNRNCPVCKSQNTKSLTIFCSRCRQYYLRYKVTKDYYGFMKTKFICNICLEMEPNSKMIQ